MIIDSNISCLNQSEFLLGKGVTAVGRYYRQKTHLDWVITAKEAQELSGAGIQIFTVFEDYGKASELTLSADQGTADAQSALRQAGIIGQPQGSAIYFAVEGLPNGYTSADLPNIRNYFSGVKTAIGAKYAIGVYGDGVVCQTLLDEGICKFTWLAAASTSFEGTTAFFQSRRWSLAQMAPLDIKNGWNGLSVDINQNIGDFGAFVTPTTQV